VVGSSGSDSISSPPELEVEVGHFPPELDGCCEFLESYAPLFQINLLPDLMQVNFLFPA
jgi:hypothetical protein